MGREETDDPRQVTFISWVDFVRVEGKQYINAAAGTPFGDGVGRGLSPSDLGQPYTCVQFQVSGSVRDDLSYVSKDGDAAFLPVGTVIYRVRDYSPAFRLAAWQTCPTGEELCLYEVDSSPEAQRGADLLDIDDRAQSIRILSAQDGRTELGRVDAAEQIQALVGMILSASVDQLRHEHDGPQYFLAFVLHDGTAVKRSYWPESRELSRGILLPIDFRDTVLAGLPRL